MADSSISEDDDFWRKKVLDYPATMHHCMHYHTGQGNTNYSHGLVQQFLLSILSSFFQQLKVSLILANAHLEFNRRYGNGVFSPMVKNYDGPDYLFFFDKFYRGKINNSLFFYKFEMQRDWLSTSLGTGYVTFVPIIPNIETDKYHALIVNEVTLDMKWGYYCDVNRILSLTIIGKYTIDKGRYTLDAFNKFNKKSHNVSNIIINISSFIVPSKEMFLEWIKYELNINSFQVHSNDNSLHLIYEVNTIEDHDNGELSLIDYNIRDDIFDHYPPNKIEIGKFNKKKSYLVFSLLLMIETFPLF